jgi:peptidoglycan hydrolase-like protein with peptidoglycan-binding domain
MWHVKSSSMDPTEKGMTMTVRSRTIAAIAAVALVLSGCGVFSDASDVEAAQAQFCADVEAYVTALDTYGGLFSDTALTVGDVRTAGEDLEPARDAVQSSADQFREAVDSDPTAGVSIEIVEPETLEAVRSADAAFTAAIEGIDEETPVTEAGVSFTSAAYALEVAWVRVFADAGCFDDSDEAEAKQWVADYVAALQTDLQAAGYYTGEIDGLYGPGTIDAVERLQAATGLPVTGLPDPATQAALNAALGGIGSAQTGAIQGILITLGYYPGPVDGQWSPQLEEALKAFQTDLGVPATGIVDAETLRAFEDALTEAGEPPATTTTVSADTTTTVAPPTTTVPETTTTTTPEETTTTSTTVPPVQEPGILDVLTETGQFTQLLAAIDAAGLTETLSGPGPFTLFAPTDQAFALIEGQLPADAAELQAILLYHVVEDAVNAFELSSMPDVASAQGASITISLDQGLIVLNGASRITISNVAGGNGFAHVVDAVLSVPAG